MALEQCGMWIFFFNIVLCNGSLWMLFDVQNNPKLYLNLPNIFIRATGSFKISFYMLCTSISLLFCYFLCLL